MKSEARPLAAAFERVSDGRDIFDEEYEGRGGNVRETKVSNQRRGSGSRYRTFQTLEIDDGDADDDAENVTPSSGGADSLPLSKLVFLNVGNFGAAYLWFGLQIQTIPSQIRALAGESKKGTYLGVVVGCGAVLTFFVSPLVGKMSDAYGRRFPLMCVGVVATAVALLLLGAASPHIPDTTEHEDEGLDEPLESWGIGGYLSMFLFMQMAYLVLSVPYQAHLAEATPGHQRGKSSGVNASVASVGMLLSAAIGISYSSMPNVVAAYSVPASVLILSFAATLACGPSDRNNSNIARSNGAAVTASASRPGQEKDFAGRARRLLETYIAPFRNHDFRWVFFTRFLMQQGVSTISWFLEYFLSDVVDLGNVDPETAVSYAFLPMLVASGFSSIGGGWLSDRWGGRRKILVIASAVVMSCCSFVAGVFTRDLISVCLLMFVFGLGYGMFLAVDFALVMDVLPSDADVSRDMAIWHNALVIPQLLATPIGGAIRDSFEGETGYVLLFIITCAYFSLSAYFVTRIRGAR